jgi:hypothetical protein
MKKVTYTYNMPSGGTYRIQYRRTGLFGGTYKMRVLQKPNCAYPLGVPAHLLAEDHICVAAGREPATIEQAKAIAFHWMSGFETYRRTGSFPNGRARFDVKEVH